MVQGLKHVDGSLEDLVGAATRATSFVHHRWLTRWDVQVILANAQHASIVAPQPGSVVEGHPRGIVPGVHLSGVGPVELRTVTRDREGGR